MMLDEILPFRHLLTVGAEQTFKLGHQAHQVELLQEAFVLHSRVQLHDKATGQGRQLETTHEAASTERSFPCKREAGKYWV